MEYSGLLTVHVYEAVDLKPTAFSKRLPGINVSTLDTYVEVSVDDHVIGKTSTKHKTLAPIWNEILNDEVRFYVCYCLKCACKSIMLLL